MLQTISIVVISVCSIAYDKCHDEPIALAEPIPMVGCLMAGPRIGAEYVKDHPWLRFTGWKCEPDEGKKTPT